MRAFNKSSLSSRSRVGPGETAEEGPLGEGENAEVLKGLRKEAGAEVLGRLPRREKGCGLSPGGFHPPPLRAEAGGGVLALVVPLWEVAGTGS